ncbi:transcriptional regulator [Pelagicoccus sp. SDUM812003]|uniref:helix-turn-helix transcriptional regulator n=1 Tax=Pelagicoccus sp. SDUM812003 TaxID=3041267 RepID=UPI00281037E7|nr:transcriptional regulator [Pelagicoccus sp. SDUM812003]MDQ8201677.1 transcriptional regulator [Pelagicoccus sp. SDUM812003]
MPLKDGSYKGANWATRTSLIEMLKRRGPLSSQDMAEVLGVSSMAIRQHMQELEQAGEVASENRSQGKGRPTKFWKLTERANRHFPDRHRDLMVDLLGNVKAVLGPDALDKVLDERGQHQASCYREKLAGISDLKQRIEGLAKLRSEEGYMAEVMEEEGAFLLVENHCPICAAARSCSGLCDRELQVFRSVLGERCRIERVEHLLSDGRRCAYRVAQHNA